MKNNAFYDRTASLIYWTEFKENMESGKPWGDNDFPRHNAYMRTIRPQRRAEEAAAKRARVTPEVVKRHQMKRRIKQLRQELANSKALLDAYRQALFSATVCQRCGQLTECTNCKSYFDALETAADCINCRDLLLLEDCQCSPAA